MSNEFQISITTKDMIDYTKEDIYCQHFRENLLGVVGKLRCFLIAF